MLQGGEAIVYVDNLGDEGERRVRQAYGPNHNPNIRPAAQVA